MTQYVARETLQVAESLADFLEDQALPGTGVPIADFWTGFAALIHDLGPRNRELLSIREDMQGKIDDWHVARRGQPHDAATYEAFLREIGYLVPEGDDFEVVTANVDPEIAHIPGPQLVVPIMNARFALNAANARWGSLYDALYGTDALGDLPAGGAYDPERGARVIAWAKQFMDEAVPLDGASWADVDDLSLDGNGLRIAAGGKAVALVDPAQYAGHSDPDGWELFLFRNNGLGIEVAVKRDHEIGGTDPAGIASPSANSIRSSASRATSAGRPAATTTFSCRKVSLAASHPVFAGTC